MVIANFGSGPGGGGGGGGWAIEIVYLMSRNDFMLSFANTKSME